MGLDEVDFIVYLLGIARRTGVPLTLESFDEVSREIPVIANVRPSGAYLMEDFYCAGGMLGLMTRLRGHLATSCTEVTGRPLAEMLASAGVYNDDVIRELDNPVYPEGATAVLFGNLAPDGCVIKPAAADQSLLEHKGPAIVFHDYNDMARRISNPRLDATREHVLVLQHAGPIGAPGMPEWGQLPIPKPLLADGVRDIVRISDARMSGTSYGACVLQVAPESAVGGPLDLVEDGDTISGSTQRRGAGTPPHVQSRRVRGARYRCMSEPGGCPYVTPCHRPTRRAGGSKTDPTLPAAGSSVGFAALLCGVTAQFGAHERSTLMAVCLRVASDCRAIRQHLRGVVLAAVLRSVTEP